MNRLRSEAGFSLPELLTTMTIAIIVSLATFTLIEITMKRSGEVGSRVETTATARTAMDQITRQLRSQVCVKANESTAPRSLAAATPTSLTVYTDFSNEPLTSGLLPAPDLRKVSWASNTFTETVTKGTRLASNNTVTYGSAATARTFLTKVKPVLFTNSDATKPVIFRYYRFPDLPSGSSILPPGSTASIEIVPTGSDRSLTVEQLGAVARISVDFKVMPRTGSASGATQLKNDVYVRTADPNAQTPKPTCLTY